MSQSQQEAQQVYGNLLQAKAKLEEATRLAAKINKPDLGRNENRLMEYAGSVLLGLKEANFNLIASVTLKLIQDQAVAQIVGWQSVESRRRSESSHWDFHWGVPTKLIGKAVYTGDSERNIRRKNQERQLMQRTHPITSFFKPMTPVQPIRDSAPSPLMDIEEALDKLDAICNIGKSKNISILRFDSTVGHW